MLGIVDLLSLGFRPVIEPEDDIAVVIIFGRGDGDRFVGIGGEDGERACRVKSNSSNGSWVNVVLVQNAVDGLADAPPHIICGLFLSMNVSPARILSQLIKGGGDKHNSHARAAISRYFLKPSRQYLHGCQ